MNTTPICYKCKSNKYVRLKHIFDGDCDYYDVWYCEKCHEDA